MTGELVKDGAAIEAADAEIYAAGVAKLEALGLAHLGDIQVDAGELCKGSLAQFLGDARHGRVAEQVVATAESAAAEGKNVEEAVLAPLAFFVKKDEQGEFVRVEPPILENAQKKTF